MKRKYQDGSPIAEHPSKFKDLLNQLGAVQMTFDDEVQALILMGSLPDSWETPVVSLSLSNSAPDGKVTMKMVSDSMRNEENRSKELGINPQSQVLVSEKRGRSKSRNPKNHDDHDDKSRGRSKPRKEFTRFHCGHKKYQCRQWKREQNKERGDDRKENNTTATASDGDIAIICDNDSINLTHNDSQWVIDSGASYHVTSRRDFFTSYSSSKFGYVKMGNDVECKIAGTGDVCLETNNGCKLLLKNVRHVPDTRLNLISTGVLDDEGYQNDFGEGKWK